MKIRNTRNELNKKKNKKKCVNSWNKNMLLGSKNRKNPEFWIIKIF